MELFLTRALRFNEARTIPLKNPIYDYEQYIYMTYVLVI